MHPFILFLDFDGVLHPGTTGTMRHVPVLDAFLRDYLAVRLVVSSDWRLSESLEDLRGWFPDGLARRLIDTTPALNPTACHRQREIEAWLATHPTQLWRALDDEATLFAHGCPWLVQTERRHGLDERALAQLALVLDGAGLRSGR